MDNGGIPRGSLEHEQPYYYLDKYNELLKKHKELEKRNEGLHDKINQDSRVIKQLNDHLHEFVESMENRIRGQVGFTVKVRCPFCGYNNVQIKE